MDKDLAFKGPVPACIYGSSLAKLYVDPAPEIFDFKDASAIFEFAPEEDKFRLQNCIDQMHKLGASLCTEQYSFESELEIKYSDLTTSEIEKSEEMIAWHNWRNCVKFIQSAGKRFVKDSLSGFGYGLVAFGIRPGEDIPVWIYPLLWLDLKSEGPGKFADQRRENVFFAVRVIRISDASRIYDDYRKEIQKYSISDTSILEKPFVACVEKSVAISNDTLSKEDISPAKSKNKRGPKSDPEMKKILIDIMKERRGDPFESDKAAYNAVLQRKGINFKNLLIPEIVSLACRSFSMVCCG